MFLKLKNKVNETGTFLLCNYGTKTIINNGEKSYAEKYRAAFTLFVKFDFYLIFVIVKLHEITFKYHPRLLFCYISNF